MDRPRKSGGANSRPNKSRSDRQSDRGSDRGSDRQGKPGARSGGRFQKSGQERGKAPRGKEQGEQQHKNRREKNSQTEEPRRLEPEIPQEIYREEIDPQLLRELSSLASDNAEQTARHLLALVHFLGEDPERAHAHGVAASARAARVGRVRELAGIAAYNAGKYEIALRELKTAFRITGDPSLWALMADSQRGLGEPLKAIEMGKAPEVSTLDKDAQVELRIVLSGARRDLGELEAALTAVHCKELNEENGSWAARLRYAYADALAALGRQDQAREWFQKAASVDINQETDAQERITQLR